MRRKFIPLGGMNLQAAVAAGRGNDDENELPTIDYELLTTEL